MIRERPTSLSRIALNEKKIYFRTWTTRKRGKTNLPSVKQGKSRFLIGYLYIHIIFCIVNLFFKRNTRNLYLYSTIRLCEKINKTLRDKHDERSPTTYFFIYYY